MKITTQIEADAVKAHIDSVDLLRKANLTAPSDSATLDEYRAALDVWNRRDEFDPAKVGELSERAKQFLAWMTLKYDEKVDIYNELKSNGLWVCPNSSENRAAYAKWLSEQSEFKPGDLVLSSGQWLRILKERYEIGGVHRWWFNGGFSNNQLNIRKVTRVTHATHGPGTVLNTREGKFVLVQFDCGHTSEHKLEELKAL